MCSNACKLFNSCAWKAEIITVKLKANLLLNASLCNLLLTFITEALHLSGILSVVVLCHFSVLWQSFTMVCAKKARLIHFINGKCHNYKQLKAGKSHLTNYTRSISHHIMLLFINALGGRNTDTQTHTRAHTYTYTQTKAISRAHGLQASCTWFKKQRYPS